MKKVIVIGAGFAGLSAATKLADEGCDVTIIEKTQWLVEGQGSLTKKALCLICS